MFKKIYLGGKNFYKITQDNDLLILASDLTLKIIVSGFPFLMFLVAVLGTFDLDITELFSSFTGNIPSSVLDVLQSFLDSIDSKGSATGLISTTLFFAIISASSGFVSVNRGIARIYNVTDTRNYVHKRLVCMLQVVLFALSILFSLVAIIFGDVIIGFLKEFEFLPIDYSNIYDATSNFVIFSIMVVMIMLIYSVGHKRVKFFTTIPGATFTVIFWYFSSKGYNVYINNFSSYSSVYGALGTILIFIFWVNIISVVLLIGCQINALIDEALYKEHMTFKSFIKSLINLFKPKKH